MSKEAGDKLKGIVWGLIIFIGGVIWYMDL
jgi:hypothetical protein